MTSCEHENADHLMPAQPAAEWDGPLDGYVANCEQLRCLDCGAWLSLGQSVDSAPKAIAIEVRAAELARDLQRGSVDGITDGMSIADPDERDGWYGWPHSHPPRTKGRLAGFLAAQIQFHDREQNS